MQAKVSGKAQKALRRKRHLRPSHQRRFAPSVQMQYITPCAHPVRRQQFRTVHSMRSIMPETMQMGSGRGSRSSTAYQAY